MRISYNKFPQDGAAAEASDDLRKVDHRLLCLRLLLTPTGKANRRQFSIQRMLVAMNRIAVSLAVSPTAFHIFPFIIPSIMGICWLGAVSVARSGWQGFVQSIVIGDFLLPSVLALLVIIHLR